MLENPALAAQRPQRRDMEPTGPRVPSLPGALPFTSMPPRGQWPWLWSPGRLWAPPA